jgi:hypothetical protein
MSFIFRLSSWKKAAFVNAFGLVGILVSLFAIPQDTPVWILAVSSLAALALLNYLAFSRRKSRPKEAQHAHLVSRSTLVILGAALLLIIDLIWMYYDNHR